MMVEINRTFLTNDSEQGIRLATELSGKFPNSARAAILLAGCGGGGESETAPVAAVIETAGPLTVYAVNYPLAYFAERIGGDDVVVHFPVPAGDDPAFWSPDARTVRRSTPFSSH